MFSGGALRIAALRLPFPVDQEQAKERGNHHSADHRSQEEYNRFVHLSCLLKRVFPSVSSTAGLILRFPFAQIRP